MSSFVTVKVICFKIMFRKKQATLIKLTNALLLEATKSLIKQDGWEAKRCVIDNKNIKVTKN